VSGKEQWDKETVTLVPGVLYLEYFSSFFLRSI